MEYTPDELRCRYPEFQDTTEYPDSRLCMFITDAQDEIGADSGHWGNDYRYSRALAALTAHMLVIGTNSEYGDTGPMQQVSQKSAGEVKVHLLAGRATPKSQYEARLMSTTYGQEFLTLRRKSFITVLAVTEDS